MTERKHRRRGGSFTFPKGSKQEEIDAVVRRRPRQTDGRLWPDSELARLFNEIKKKYADDPRAAEILGKIAKIRDPRSAEWNKVPPEMGLPHVPYFGHAAADPDTLLFGMRLERELMALLEPEFAQKWLRARHRAMALGPRGFGGLKRAVERILDTLDRSSPGAATANEVLNALKDDDFVQDVCQSLSEPIALEVLELDEDIKRMSYRLDGREKSVSFSRIRAIVSELKHPRR